ncbi:MAG: PQQ-like beta-propeller repeat protein [Planctomycetales bacterium]|nr:PQQ-like beta-propeller repeat protein [Planctomycetales bacterium]MCA9226972.1 PQQ-like beta-propeller repeat protein [Planctomycetales bacterium]
MRIVLSVCLLFVGQCAAQAQPYWNQFRGPQGNGQTDATGLPVEFGEKQNLTWKTPIPGKAWASPVIWENQIWLANATEDGKRLSAVCVDLKSGEVLHDVLVFEVAEPEFCHPTNSYASCTPFVEAGRVYLHYGTYGTACLDTKTGEKLWERRDLHCDHFRGPASSPLVEGDLLYLTYDGIDIQYVVALNKHTGTTVWQKDRNINYGTDNPDQKKGYSTPTVIEAAGRRQLISPSAAETISYDPATGEELWRVHHGGMNAAARPLYVHGLVYITAGDGGKSLVAVRPEGRGDVTNSQIEWETGKSVPKRSSLIIVGDLLFMVSDSGTASCLDAKSGEIHWSKRLPGEYWASPLLANGLLYFFSKGGDVVVLKAAAEYEEVAESKLDSGMNASPAVSGNSLIVRTFKHLYRFDKAQ